MTPKRPRKNQRADDQARLASEVATDTGPQAANNKGGRPRKHPLPDPAAPKRKRGRPRKDAPPPTEPNAVEPEGPPEVEPDAVDDGPPCDETGKPLSMLWSVVRRRFDASIRVRVEDLMRLGSLDLDDLVWLEMAEHDEMGRLMDTATERFQEKLVVARLQSRKQIMRIIVERGPRGGVNAQNVKVPDGLDLDSLTFPPDEGDDVLAEPDIEALPERYRDAARAARTPQATP